MKDMLLIIPIVSESSAELTSLIILSLLSHPFHIFGLQYDIEISNIPYI